MDNRERRDAGLAYVADGSVFEEMQECKKMESTSGWGRTSLQTTTARFWTWLRKGLLL